MTESDLLQMLDEVRSGALAPRKAMERLKLLPFEDLDFAKVDHHRALRQGFAEVVFGKGKTAKQVAEIVTALLGRKPGRQNILVTRADSKMFAAVKRAAGKKNGDTRSAPGWPRQARPALGQRLNSTRRTGAVSACGSGVHGTTDSSFDQVK